MRVIHVTGYTGRLRVSLLSEGRTGRTAWGVSVCKMVSVDGHYPQVEGLDAIDSSPMIDIKSVMREFQPREEVRQPEWVTELMAAYW